MRRKETHRTLDDRNVRGIEHTKVRYARMQRDGKQMCFADAKLVVENTNRVGSYPPRSLLASFNDVDKRIGGGGRQGRRRDRGQRRSTAGADRGRQRIWLLAP